MNKIDLNTIIDKVILPANYVFDEQYNRCIHLSDAKLLVKESIHQALKLASENATTKQISSGEIGFLPSFRGTDKKTVVDKQSILDIEKLII